MEKKLFIISIPIPDLHSDNIEHHKIFILSSKCPNLEELKEILNKNNLKDILEAEKHPELNCFYFVNQHCLDSLNLVRKDQYFPSDVGENGLVASNCIVEMSKYGRQSIYISVSPLVII